MIYEDKPSLEEIYSTVFESEDDIQHYGVKRRSGRYPWGSGDNGFQRSADFLARVDELKKQGLSESKIAEALGIVNEKGQPSSTRLRTQLSLAKEERRGIEVAQAKDLRAKGYSLNEIAEKMGYKNDSSIRSLLNEKSEVRMNQARNTAEFLKKKIDEKGMLDVGTGVELELNISKEKLDQALYILELEGYPTYSGRVPQATNPGKHTTIKVIGPPGTEHKDIYQYDKISSVKEYISKDDGETFHKFEYPKSMDSNRLMIRYKEDGGIDKDGIVELRRGVADLDLNGSHYSQVRILVDDKKYIKGMAVYGDDKDFPPGVDVIFNTNKSKDVPKLDVLKNIKDDKDNPFGSLIKAGGQSRYIDKDGKEQLSLINKRADEGDWEDWANKVPAQFLSKQPLSLAKRQLKIAEDEKMAEFNEINSLTNPTVKKRLLQSFADDCDSAAVHLKAAALPRQKYHVIIPINTLKDNEVYAPNYEDGEKLALVRYPHGGTFEIPIVTVNNKHAPAKKLLGNVKDAVGINARVAERLSGADFDGDTVMAIPTNDKIKIKSTDQLKGLVGFDPKMAYGTTDKKTGKYDEKGKEIVEYYNAHGNKIKVMANTQNEMGRISNLITDMTLKGAKEDELAKAVRHSMVVIDAEKHKLDYKQSYIDNDIETLKKRYQDGGASTLISKAKGEYQVDKRQGSPKINLKGKEWYDPSRPEGSLIYKTADDLYYDVHRTNKRTGEVTIITKKRTEPSTNMAETDDAFTLVSNENTPMERAYATYANKMKALANEARKTLATTGKIEYNPSAKEVYQKEVVDLNNKLKESLKNAPKERQAQTIANSIVKAKQQENPDMTKGDIKKASQQALEQARNQVGAKRTLIEITAREWEAIQAGAISENTLSKILNNTDIDKIRELATPRQTKSLSQAKINKIQTMHGSGKTNKQIADALGVSVSTVIQYLK